MKQGDKAHPISNIKASELYQKCEDKRLKERFSVSE